MSFPSAETRPTSSPGDVRLPVARREVVLTILLILWATFQPWAFGGRDLVCQVIATGLAAFAFGIAAWPKPGAPPIGSNRQQLTVRNLLRRPVVLLSLAIFAYAAIQAANPVWEYRTANGYWRMVGVDGVHWLPHGYTAPFERMNIPRAAFFWSSPLLAACAVWLGVTRRDTALVLLTAIFVNGSAIAGLALAQQATGTEAIFWRFHFERAQPLGSFVYRNHGAAFLTTIALLGGGLALRAFLHGRMRQRKSTPAALFALMSAAAATAIVGSASRAGTAIVATGLGAFYFAAWRAVQPKRIWLPTLVCLLTMAGIIGGALYLNPSRIAKRAAQLVHGTDEVSLRGRIYYYEATRRMFVDQPLFGVGWRGFRYRSPAYLQDMPDATQDVFLDANGPTQKSGVSVIDSHSDLLQTAAEMGILGGGLVAALLAVALADCTVNWRRHPLAASAAIALIAFTAYAAIDFPTNNAAVVATVVICVVASGRLAEIETRGPSAPPTAAGKNLSRD